jgi:hypothetical protein
MRLCSRASGSHRLSSPSFQTRCEDCSKAEILAGLVRDAYVHLGSDAIPERLRLTGLSLALVDFGILKASELEQGAFPLTFSR